MFGVHSLLKICLILVFSISQIAPSSYNLETESLRIYGESFGSLLKQFRRTPEYLEILKEKYAELQLLFLEIFMHATQYVTENNMKKIVAATCGFEEHTTPHASRMIPVRRQEGDGNNGAATKTPVDLLDNYPRFQSFLTTQERNKFRDIGFENAGKLFHMVMEAMGPVESNGKSTKRPFDDEEAQTATTEKDHRHQGRRSENCTPVIATMQLIKNGSVLDCHLSVLEKVTQLGPDIHPEDHITHEHDRHEHDVTHESLRYKFINF